jgi:hypothetical protein
LEAYASGRTADTLLKVGRLPSLNYARFFQENANSRVSSLKHNVRQRGEHLPTAAVNKQ